MPGLRSFCLNCALNVLAIYLLQTSWFVAWFALIQRWKPQKTPQKRAGKKCSSWNSIVARSVASGLTHRTFKVCTGRSIVAF